MTAAGLWSCAALPLLLPCTLPAHLPSVHDAQSPMLKGHPLVPAVSCLVHGAIRIGANRPPAPGAPLANRASLPAAGGNRPAQQPLVSSDFMQTDYSNSVDSALTMVMGEDLVKVVMWYDNEWGYSQRVLDLTAIVAAKLPVAA